MPGFHVTLPPRRREKGPNELQPDQFAVRRMRAHNCRCNRNLLGVGSGPPREECEMTFKLSILVLANRTALSAGLEEALRVRADAAPTTFTLVVPIGRSLQAQQRAQELAAQLCEA